MNPAILCNGDYADCVGFIFVTLNCCNWKKLTFMALIEANNGQNI